jgi:hypothetical protein
MNDKIAEAGKLTQFSATNQPENAGRKRNFFNYLKDENNLSQSDLDNIVNHISCLPMEEVNRLLDLIKGKSNAEEIRRMPLLYFKVLEGMVKAKTNDILAYMRMSGKAAESHRIVDNNNNDLPISIIIKDAERTDNRSTPEVKTDIQQST